MTKVSINILTWNSGKYIKRCLEHCLAQNYDSFEVIVIDNYSSDNTLKICADFSDKIKIIKNDYNLGYSGGHNVGIRASTAEYVLVLNPDVYLSEEYVKNIIQFLDKNKEYGGAIGRIYQYIAEENRKEKELYIDTMGLKILRSRQFIARNFGVLESETYYRSRECFGIDGMASVYRRTMLEEIKIYDEYFDEDFFAYCEDQDLSWRGRNYGWKFAFIDESIAYHVRTWKPRSLKYRIQIPSHVRRMALRNHYLMILKNDDVVLFLMHFPFILIRFLKILIYSSLFEQKTLLAFYDFLKLSKKIINKRKIIRSFKKVNLSEIKDWYKL